jgi:hypothetical protein
MARAKEDRSADVEKMPPVLCEIKRYGKLYDVDEGPTGLTELHHRGLPTKGCLQGG